MSSHASKTQDTSNPERRRRESYWTILRRMQLHNPVRLPSWRWEWALRFADSRQQLSKRCADPLLRIAVEFHYTLRPNRIVNWSRLRPVYVDLLVAFNLSQNNDRQRAELEARVLAGQTDAEIGECVGMSARAVALYVGVFFDVRDRLRAREWIRIYAIERAGYMAGDPMDDIWQAWRAIGYSGGREPLDAVIAAVESKDLNIGLGQCDLQTPEGRLTARARMAVATMTLELTPKMARELLQIRNLIARIEREQQACAPNKVVETLIDQVLVGQTGATLPASPAVSVPVAPADCTVASEDSGDAVVKDDQQAA